MKSVDQIIMSAISIQGWKTPEELAWIAKRSQQASLIIDVGCWRGRTTRVMAAFCLGTVIAVDRRSGRYTGEAARNEVIEREGFERIITDFRKNLRDEVDCGAVIPVFMNGAQAHEEVRKVLASRTADFVWIDGDHGAAEVRADILFYRSVLAPGGILSGHDYDPAFPDVIRVVDELCPDRQLGHGSSWYCNPPL